MTALSRFTGENLRCIKHVVLEEMRGINLLVGANGAGKTSVLEGIHILGTGRSFRTRQLSTVSRRGSDYLRVVGSVDDGVGQIIQVGVERSDAGLRMRCAGERVNQTSLLARALPVLVIRPESQEVFTGASEERRRVLDWAVFHVEPSFGDMHGRYQRALKQRNAALRLGVNPRDLIGWDEEVAASGSLVDAARQRFVTQCGGILIERLQGLTGLPVEIRYRRGWPDHFETLADALSDGAPGDRERGTTQRGPHRADLKFMLDGTDARTVLSRGEGKRIVLGTLLVLAEQVALVERRKPVILLDDLASELDDAAREAFLDQVQALGCQTFVTAVDETLVSERHRRESAVFHVKQGEVARVL